MKSQKHISNKKNVTTKLNKMFKKRSLLGKPKRKTMMKGSGMFDFLKSKKKVN